MNPLAAITALLEALTQAAKAFPLWLAWKITGECEQLTRDIITHENSHTASDKSRADELRISLAYRRRLHDALLPAHVTSGKGNEGSNIVRAVSVPD